VPVEVWELLIREQVRTTLTNYSTAVDAERFTDVAPQPVTQQNPRILEIVKLFTEDAIMEVTPLPPATGRAAIVELLTGLSAFGPPANLPGQGPMVRHFTTNVHFRSVGPDRVETTSYVCIMTTAGADHWGRYFDVLVPVGDEWLFSHRIAKTEAWDPGGWHAQWRQRR
jgi:hypothetical protein